MDFIKPPERSEFGDQKLDAPDQGQNNSDHPEQAEPVNQGMADGDELGNREDESETRGEENKDESSLPPFHRYLFLEFIKFLDVLDFHYRGDFRFQFFRIVGIRLLKHAFQPFFFSYTLQGMMAK